MSRSYTKDYRGYYIRVRRNVLLRPNGHGLWRGVVNALRSCCVGATVTVMGVPGYGHAWERDVHRCDIVEDDDAFEERLKGVLLEAKRWVDDRVDLAEKERGLLDEVLGEEEES